MNAPIQDQCSTASDYIELIKNTWPVITVCFFASFFWGLQRIKNGYKGQNTLQIIGNLIFTSLGAVVLGYGCVLLLPYIYPEVTPNIEMGVAIIVAIFGQKILDVYLMKKFGLKTFDLMNQDDIDHINIHMKEQSIKNNAIQCPFKEDMDDMTCHNCETCKVRLEHEVQP